MEKINKISLKVNYDLQPKEDIALIGFLFYCNGLLLQRQPVNKNVLEFNLSDTAGIAAGQSNLDIDPKELRVFIAPASDKKIQQVTTVEELESYKPYEPILTRDLRGNFSILPVPEIIGRFWPLCNCRVMGKVSKWFHVGNTWSDRAVCRARVHICEVDPIRYWIYKIPDTIIAKIPDEILQPGEIIKFPIPIPDPPPFAQANIRAVQQASIFATVSAGQKQMEAAAKLPELGMDIRQNLASGNLDLIRETIVNNYSLFHPWFCYWPWWWPYFYRCTEKKIVYTDANGRFDTNISYQCFGDKPDIYIWVEYYINGVWTTVYKPPVPCYTYWDYDCGTNISIHITDPRVPGNCCCDCPLPGELVWVKRIGGTSITHIKQTSFLQPPPGQTVSYDRIGLTDAGANGDGFFSTSVGDYKRPFGGTLSFYMGFGSDLPNSGIAYYRWKYRKTHNADLTAVSGTTEELDVLEMKGYDFIYTDVNNDIQVGHNSVKIGPFPVGPNNNLYKIPPPKPSMAPFNVPETDPDWFERTRHTHTISVDTTQLKNGSVLGGDGLYEFTLELFNQAGALLNNIPKSTFKAQDYNDEDATVNASDELLAGVTATTADAFKMLLRIDNSVCHGNIFTVNVNGLPASADCCGFVKYKPGGVEADLELSFLATHPNNFAVFSFSVAKGTCGPVAGAGAGGMVIDSDIVNGYALNSGVYSKHFTPEDLLDNCYKKGEGKAAFAEGLAVIAMATDGSNRLSYNDAQSNPSAGINLTAAFALEP